jgi:hypothetical protein
MKETPVAGERIHLATDREIEIEQRLLPEDPELAPDAAIIGTYLAGRLIGKVAVPPDSFSTDELGFSSAQLEYLGTELEDKSIKAQICARVEAEREAWQETAEHEHVMLGTVVRLAKDRRHLTDLQQECVEHFAAILQGQAVPLVDKMLEGI